jgi:hypothetical protein
MIGFWIGFIGIFTDYEKPRGEKIGTEMVRHYCGFSSDCGFDDYEVGGREGSGYDFVYGFRFRGRPSLGGKSD